MSTGIFIRFPSLRTYVFIYVLSSLGKSLNVIIQTGKISIQPACINIHFRYTLYMNETFFLSLKRVMGIVDKPNILFFQCNDVNNTPIINIFILSLQ